MLISTTSVEIISLIISPTLVHRKVTNMRFRDKSRFKIILEADVVQFGWIQMVG